MAGAPKGSFLDILGEWAYYPRHSRRQMTKPIELLQGTLDMLILKALALGFEHGYGILLRI